MEIPADLDPFYDVSMIWGSLVFCRTCKAEVQYSSAHPQFTDENFLDHARAMKASGWTICPDDTLDVLCPRCSK